MNADIAGELTNPHTPAARLHEIAAAHPELGAQIAAHANCYPELREWIASYSVGQAEPQAEKRSLWKPLAVTAAVLVPVITVATIAIPLLANLNEKSTSSETLTASVEPAQTEGVPDPLADAQVIGENTTRMEGALNYAHWMIPIDAPIDSFPLAVAPDYYNCGEAQLAWLHEHAERNVPEVYKITLHNSSTVGGSLSLGNIRFLGEEQSDTPIMMFSCPRGGSGGGDYNQGIRMSLDGREAVFGEPHYDMNDPNLEPVGSPAILNLAPGEIVEVPLELDTTVDRTKRFHGRFVADLTDSSGETVVLADDILIQQRPLAGFYFGYLGGTYASDVPQCISPSYGGYFDEYGKIRPVPCSLNDAVAIFREAREATGR